MKDTDQRIAALGAEVKRLRRRLREELEGARLAGQSDALAELFDFVDDCDRAVEILSDEPQMRGGLEGARGRIIERFASFGFSPVGEPGEDFNPEIHEAIDVDHEAPEGIISRVHRRGWLGPEGTLVRPAAVTVGKKDES